MNKTLRVICMLIIAVAFYIPAHADTITNYTINFTTADGPPPLSGSFTYNSTAPLFTNFLVTWNGNTYNLTAEANSPTLGGSGFTGASSTPAYGFGIMSRSLTYNGLTSFVWSGYAGQGIGGAGIFDFIAGTPVGNDFISDGGVGTGSPTAVGFYTITETSSVPEPTSLILLLGIGLGAVSLFCWRFKV